MSLYITKELQEKIQKEMWDYLQKISKVSDMWYEASRKTFKLKQQELRCERANGALDAYNEMVKLYNKWFDEGGDLRKASENTP